MSKPSRSMINGSAATLVAIALILIIIIIVRTCDAKEATVNNDSAPHPTEVLTPGSDSTQSTHGTRSKKATKKKRKEKTKEQPVNKERSPRDEIVP